MVGKFVNFFKEVRVELKKVSWSTRDELIGSTMVVVVTVLILAIFIGICDFFLSRFISVLIR